MINQVIHADMCVVAVRFFTAPFVFIAEFLFPSAANMRFPLFKTIRSISPRFAEDGRNQRPAGKSGRSGHWFFGTFFALDSRNQAGFV